MPTTTPEVEAQCFIMAGGNGTRLEPFTDLQPKPLLLLGTDNRLIDPAITECLPIASSLYVASREFRAIDNYLEQRVDSAVHHAQEQGHRGHGYVLLENQAALEADQAEYVVVTPADHIRDFNLTEAVVSHAHSGVDLTILTQVLRGSERVLHDGLRIREERVTGFLDKVEAITGESTEVSVGTYIFTKASLLGILRGLDRETDFCDVGYHIVPLFLKALTVGRWVTTGYWQDMGSIQRYFDGQMHVRQSSYTLGVDQSELDKAGNMVSPHALVADHAKLEFSVIGSSVTIEDDARVEESVVMPGAVIRSGATVYRSIVGSNMEVTSYTSRPPIHANIGIIA